jgi:16S rRNA (uracil1498-N3)-methyltransferase
MTRRRWIADEVKDNRAALTGAHAAHLSRALRAQAGQEFEVVCGDVVRQAVVASANDERVEFELGNEIASPVATPITLLLAVFKFDRMDWAIEKCTELNVTSIVPVIARRTEKHLAQAAAKRAERWRRIAREASQQARRASVPEITEPVKLDSALASAGDLRIVLAESERELLLSTILRERQNPSSVVLAVGPEGGWSSDELNSFHGAQWLSASLGSTILRAETAAIAALTVTQVELNERPFGDRSLNIS